MLISTNNKVRLKNQYLTEVPGCAKCNILLNGLLIKSMVRPPRSQQLFGGPSAGYFYQNPIAWSPLFSCLICQKSITFSRIKCPKMNQPLVRRKFESAWVSNTPIKDMYIIPTELFYYQFLLPSISEASHAPKLIHYS